MKYVIIGTGVAGVSAIKEIIKMRDDNDEVVVLTDETRGFYYRPRLIQCLSGQIDVDDIIINDLDWFKKNDINLHLNEPAISVDFANSLVHTEEGKYNYDKLLLANGSHPFVPPVPGSNFENVFTLRIAEDAEKIHNYAQESEKAVVVGGGLLGLESAYNLSKTGLDVKVLEMADHLMNRQLDKKGGEILKKKLKDMGIMCQLGCMASEIIGEGKAEKVKLKSGQEIPTDFVLFSAGIRSNTELVEDTDIEVNKGIVVNNKMETSIENVYAAGDVAEFNERVYGIWGPSMEMGKIAGKNMVNKDADFDGYVSSHELKVAEVNVISVGVLEERDNITSEIKEENDTYCRVFKKQGELVGAIIVGDYEEQEEIVKKIKS